MSKLWKVIDGEPWMINPAPARQNPRLGLLALQALNPKKKKGVTMTKAQRRARMDWVRSFKTKKRRAKPHRKSNPYPLAGVALNPKRKSHRRARRNPVANYRRRHRKHNPPELLGLSIPPVESILYAGIGFAGPPALEHFLTGPGGIVSTYFPTVMTSPIGKYAVRIGSVLGLTWLTKKFVGSRQAGIVAIAGGAYVALSAVREFAPGMIPGLSAYVPMAGMGAYTGVMNNRPQRRQLGAMTFGARNSVATAPGGGAGIVAERFRRFQ